MAKERKERAPRSVVIPLLLIGKVGSAHAFLGYKGFRVRQNWVQNVALGPQFRTCKVGPVMALTLLSGFED